MAKIGKGVIVEFDFTVLDGADILFDTAKKLLKGCGIELDARLEALHLAGGNYQGALAELFSKTGGTGEPAALARELNATFNAKVAEKAASAVTGAFKNFVKTLLDKGVKVVVTTRGDAPALAAAIGDDRYTSAFKSFGHIKHGSELRHTDAGNDTGGANRARTDTYLYGIGSCLNEGKGSGTSGNVACHDIQFLVSGTQSLNHVDHPV